MSQHGGWVRVWNSINVVSTQNLELLQLCAYMKTKTHKIENKGGAKKRK